MIRILFFKQRFFLKLPGENTYKQMMGAKYKRGNKTHNKELTTLAYGMLSTKLPPPNKLLLFIRI